VTLQLCSEGRIAVKIEHQDLIQLFHWSFY